MAGQGLFYYHICDICKTRHTSYNQLRLHLASEKHRRAVDRLRKKRGGLRQIPYEIQRTGLELCVTVNLIDAVHYKIYGDLLILAVSGYYPIAVRFGGSFSDLTGLKVEMEHADGRSLVKCRVYY